MKRGKDTSAEFEGLYLVHQNVPGMQVKQFSHSTHILFIPLQGEINVIIDRLYAVGPGHMLYLPADMAHSFDSSASSGERLIAMINPRTPAAKRIQASIPSISPLSQLIKELLFYLLLHPKTLNAKSLVSVMVETLIESLDSCGNGVGMATDHLFGKIKDARVRRAASHIQDHLGDRISIDEVAKKSGLSSRNLGRLMLQEMGMTPKQFLIAARIEKAQELLLKPGSSVLNVALEVG
jgi:AraC-like DNA-binding protein